MLTSLVVGEIIIELLKLQKELENRNFERRARAGDMGAMMD